MDAGRRKEEKSFNCSKMILAEYGQEWNPGNSSSGAVTGSSPGLCVMASICHQMFACIQTWARLARGPRMYFWCLVPNLLSLWLRGPGASPNLCQLQTWCLCQGYVITGLNNLSKSLLTSVGWLPQDKPSLMDAIFPLAPQTPVLYLTTRNVKAFLLFS